jgi:hypothetical protein
VEIQAVISFFSASRHGTASEGMPSLGAGNPSGVVIEVDRLCVTKPDSPICS